MRRHANLSQRQYRRSQIDKADELFDGLPFRQLAGVTDNKRDADSRIVRPSFGSRKPFAVIASS
jgi:hypothetical protein